MIWEDASLPSIYFFFNNWVEFNNEAIWTWSFHCRQVLNHKSKFKTRYSAIQIICLLKEAACVIQGVNFIKAIKNCGIKLFINSFTIPSTSPEPVMPCLSFLILGFMSFFCSLLSLSSYWSAQRIKPSVKWIFSTILLFSFALISAVIVLKINQFVYFWLCWVFIAALRLSLVAASRGYSSFQYEGFSSWWLLLVQNMSSVVVAHGFNCSMACGISPDQGSNLCPLHWQAGS